jgi:transcriptional adapter 2-alpha
MLHPQEKDLCSGLRIYPRPYLIIKDMLLREYTTKGVLKLTHAKGLLKIDPSKTAKIYEFFVDVGWIKSVYRAT